MKYLNNYLAFNRENKDTIFKVKLVALLIINCGLLLLFGKIVFNDINLTNNNILLTKASIIIKPLMSAFGIEVAQNIIKMSILTFIILTSNLLILYFSQMLVFIILGVIARYGYKSYSNYLNNGSVEGLGFHYAMTEEEKLVIVKDYLVMNKEILTDNLMNQVINKIQLLNTKTEILGYLKSLISDNKYNILKNEILNREVIIQNTVQTIPEPDKTDYLAKGLNYLVGVNPETGLKVGLTVAVIGCVILLGLHIHNNGIQISKEMSETALKGGTQQSIEISSTMQNNAISENLLQSSLLALHKEINLNIENKVNLLHNNIIKMNENVHLDLVELQKSNLDISQSVISINKVLVENQNEVNVSITNVTSEITSLNNKLINNYSEFNVFSLKGLKDYEHLLGLVTGHTSAIELLNTQAVLFEGRLTTVGNEVRNMLEATENE